MPNKEPQSKASPASPGESELIAIATAVAARITTPGTNQPVFLAQ